MTLPIHPGALKAYRKRKRWTQPELANATSGPNKVSLPTIKRIESTKDGLYAANDRIAVTLAKVLGVSTEDLATEPTEREQHEETLRKAGYRSLRTMLDAETALAFNMVQDIYGISIRSQIEMAPLFMTLLAEGSLAWRRKRTAEIEEAADKLYWCGGGHLSFAFAAQRALDGAFEERESIAKSDLFGADVGQDTYDLGYDPSQNNPFADYLKEFAKDVEAKSVTFDTDYGWKTSDGFPNYRIGGDVIDRLTDSDVDAEYALLRGHARLKNIPDELRGEDRTEERVAWMIAQIPEEELAERRAERESLMELLNFGDLATKTPTDEAKGREDD